MNATAAVMNTRPRIITFSNPIVRAACARTGEELMSPMYGWPQRLQLTEAVKP